MPVSEQTTQILVDLGNGDRSAAKRLMPLVYDELRGLAQRYMRKERTEHTLQATAIVHEAYLRLIDQSRVDWKGRAHFFAVAAEMIRRVLVDHAREHDAAKRGGGARKVSLTDSVGASEGPDIELLCLDAALDELGRLTAPEGRGAAVLRRAEHRRDGPGAGGLTADGEVRLACGAGVAAAASGPVGKMRGFLWRVWTEIPRREVIGTRHDDAAV